MSNHYRKKPVVVEAFQMTEARRMDNSEWPQWLHEAWNKPEGEPGALFRQNLDAPLPDLLCIQTLEGVHLVTFGDWIIRGVAGELYPCKPEIFAATYESAALTQALATTERVPNRCAQCKKEYRQNATSIGCPKCAPGVRVSEDEFQKPIATTEHLVYEDGSPGPAITTERKGEPVAWILWTHGPVLVFLNKDEAKLEFDRLNHTYPEPARKLIPLYTSPQVPEGFVLVKSPITEAMHTAACKVLTRSTGLDGLPQRMLDAMLDAARKGE